VLNGNLDLTTAGITVATNSATLTLGGGTINSNGVNALSALASNTKSLTIAGAATNVSTTAASFSNTGTLTIGTGDSFTAPKLTQVTGTTLTGGTYVLDGNLNLTGAATVNTNSAVLTLGGGTIKTGATNDLATLSSNTNSLTVNNGASVSTGASFNNSGTMNVAAHSTFTVTGAANTYTQSAGSTTVDGTLADSSTTGISVTGGKIQGAGMLKAKVSIGGVGTTPALNVGDAGKAGLLKITGTYAQLSTGTMNVSVGGTTVGTQFSQLQITGAASLGGTLTAAEVNAFTPTIGQTFTILTAGSVSGTFTNTTIAINSSEHFAISYTSTGVILTVASGPVSNSSNTIQPAAQMTAVATRKPALGTLKPVAGTSMPRHRVGTGVTRPVLVASTANSGARQIFPGATSANSLRIWERVPVAPSWEHAKGLAIARSPQSMNLNAAHSDLARHINNWQGQSYAAPVHAPLSGWIGVSNSRRLPVRILTPSLPRVR
jgi:hypothetical protein